MSFKRCLPQKYMAVAVNLLYPITTKKQTPKRCRRMLHQQCEEIMISAITILRCNHPLAKKCISSQPATLLTILASPSTPCTGGAPFAKKPHKQKCNFKHSCLPTIQYNRRFIVGFAGSTMTNLLSACAFMPRHYLIFFVGNFKVFIHFRAVLNGFLSFEKKVLCPK